MQACNLGTSISMSNVQTANIQQFVEHLAQLDVEFACSHPNYGGRRTVPLSPQQLLRYVQDPVGYLAAYYGISKAQYLGWHRDNYTALCAGTTRAGKPCKNAVSGGCSVEPDRWVELQGEYCHVHQ